KEIPGSVELAQFHERPGARTELVVPGIERQCSIAFACGLFQHSAVSEHHGQSEMSLGALGAALDELSRRLIGLGKFTPLYAVGNELAGREHPVGIESERAFVRRIRALENVLSAVRIGCVVVVT